MHFFLFPNFVRTHAYIFSHAYASRSHLFLFAERVTTAKNLVLSIFASYLFLFRLLHMYIMS